MTPPRIPDLNLRFRRYECKYVLTESQVARLLPLIEPYVVRDPFAARRPDGRYGVSSLYLDSARLRLYQETRGGIRDRYKLRIRAYTDRAEDPVFFEVKKRQDRVILKERARVRRSDMLRILRGDDIDLAAMERVERSFLESFLARMRSISATPKTFVRYERQAFIGSFDSGVRVTFDRRLHALESGVAAPFFEGTGWNLVEGRRVILEFKFSGQCPFWIADAIRELGLDRISYSKYAHAIDSSDRSLAAGL